MRIPYLSTDPYADVGEADSAVVSSLPFTSPLADIAGADFATI